MARVIELRNLGDPEGVYLTVGATSVGFSLASSGAALGLDADVTGDLTGAASKIGEAAAAPVNAVAASQTIGSGENGVVTVSAATSGVAGNSYTVTVAEGSGNDVDLSAVLAGTDLTVTLGTDGGGALDAAKNTATLVAAAVDALDEFSGAASGTGATELAAAEAEQDLENGVDGTAGEAGAIALDADFLYLCTDTNTIADANWRRVSLGSAY